ncbi:MAG TPA: peptidase M3, partial [Hyphomonadaceae bacterium]|nr:peptidase M3 [Hyphomonadaceae bacterium]
MRTYALAAILLATTAMTGCATAPAGENASTAATSPAYAAAQAEVARLAGQANENILLKPWSGPHGGVPPWDQANPELVPAALELGIALQTAEVNAIAANPAAPTFDNTMAALEDAGRHLGRATTIFGVMTDNVSNEAIQTLEAEWSPKITAAFDAITFNRPLFARVHDLYGRRAELGLTPEQMRLLERTHIAFVRNGALLDEAGRARLAAIDERLSVLGTQFQQNMVADTAAWTLELRGEADMAGLPQSLRDAARQAGEGRERPGTYLITLQRSSVEPFLTYSTRRDLRERAFRAWAARGDNANQYNNGAIIREVAQLRLEKARLLGFESWAHYQVADRMAETPDRARDLMMRVWRPALAAVNADRARLQAIIDRERGGFQLAAWDWRFYAERLRQAEYNLSET